MSYPTGYSLNRDPLTASSRDWTAAEAADVATSAAVIRALEAAIKAIAALPDIRSASVRVGRDDALAALREAISEQQSVRTGLDEAIADEMESAWLAEDQAAA